MTWSAWKHRDGGTVRLNLLGDLFGPATEQLRLTIIETIEADWPDRLWISLAAVSALDTSGVAALVSGYTAAVDHGVAYQVAGAHGRVRRKLQTTGTLDVLADSDDLGALLLAVLLRPAPHDPTSAGSDRHD